ncbi:hypothetical protein [Legionella feeleii]|uniref:Uncharacterized protein n=1 Tax=Legionella feeleii TaxID=453 RepID=A0A0W0U8Q3_9GAMM|nr:hypothetical protein [Legionella feeleii]KTD04165.1 hypothetical protein Lfee_0253 [Legionella feeleii]SPX60723.1 Uncharacterised protein [Legionella feeleii]
MKKPTSRKEKAGHENAAEYNPKSKHLQSVIIQGSACQYIRLYNKQLKIDVPIDSDTEILGAGAYFPPFIWGREIDCRCLGLWSDVPEQHKPDYEIEDLSPLVEFFRLGGHLK